MKRSPGEPGALPAGQVVAYLTMEIGLQDSMPTYSGGLGVLAGDVVRTAADMQMPLVAVSLLYREGYFRQEIRPDGVQVEHPEQWRPEDFMVRLAPRVTVSIEGRPVAVAAWRYDVGSVTGGSIPVFLLDTDLDENTPEDRRITAVLYGGDSGYRLRQEVVLGMGGYRMLEALGIDVRRYHMNEGHASLLTLELLRRFRRPLDLVWDENRVWDPEEVRERCIFTTHTPVAAGHDRFDYDLVRRVVGEEVPLPVLRSFAGEEACNMTLLALNLSGYINGVAKRHGEVSRELFPGYEIHAVTNGVHSFTWTAPSLRRLYDRHLPGWAREPELLMRADVLPPGDFWEAHMEAKRRLLAEVRQATGAELDPDVMTIGFARRATAYKRADLVLSNPERLASISARQPLQVVFAGKAHPRDAAGREMIARITGILGQLRGKVRGAYLPDYGMALALRLVSGCDVWLNTPAPPREASGTSGMKAALNGVPHFSVLDGWWIEGHLEGATGWAIGRGPGEGQEEDRGEADDLYRKLEELILPLYYGRRSDWIRVMQTTVAKNAFYFSAHRMMRRYAAEAYL